MKQLDSIAKLINRFKKLPGVGLKTAERYAYSIIDMDESEVDAFVDSIKEVKDIVRYCEICGNFSDQNICKVCESRKNKDTIIVVSYPKDVLAVEKAMPNMGSFHVLHGTLSPLEGRGANDIRIKELLARLKDITKTGEVILATNPDVEGEATAMYIARLIKPLLIKTTRIAQGISMGSELEYADEVTLARALQGRVEI